MTPKCLFHYIHFMVSSHTNMIKTTVSFNVFIGILLKNKRKVRREMKQSISLKIHHIDITSWEQLQITRFAVYKVRACIIGTNEIGLWRKWKIMLAQMKCPLVQNHSTDRIVIFSWKDRKRHYYFFASDTHFDNWCLFSYVTFSGFFL